MTDLVNEIRAQGFWLPDWLASTVIFAVVVALALFIHRLAFRLLTRIVAERDLFWRSLVSRLERVARLAILTAALSFAATVSPLTEYQASTLRHILLIAFIILVAAMARTAKHIWMTVYLRRFKLDAEDNLLARKHVTQSRIIERIADLLIVMVAIASCLMTFDAVKQYGVSLLASAGVAGIVVGLALQPVLKNLFAGIQLAITQPIRIDDALLVEGEWGNVEEITSTYVVVKIWDWRRLILPLSYFIENPFPELDPRERLADRQCHALSRLQRTGAGHPQEGGGNPGRLEALGQAGGQCRRHRFQGERHGDPHPRVGVQFRPHLRPALRNPRKADRFHPAGLSACAAAGEGGDGWRQRCAAQAGSGVRPFYAPLA
ncbi:mechanosensitive ion channel family protein [Rhizobium sp. OAE497]|uniref:mechanosensitive ion channel family protein n=1 Tax=Rhizobium sp. OAE497 TaxID=2663796 RepID=UPI001A30CCD1